MTNAEVGLGRGEVGRLATARVVRHYPRILGDLSRLGLAGAALELVREAVPAREPDARVFRTTIELFERLEHADRGREELLIAFELRLMAATGFAARLDACARCGTAAPSGRAALFDPAVGAVVCRACGGGPFRLSGASRERLAACLGRSWGDAADEDWPDRVLAEARGAVAAFVAAHLGRRLEGGALVSQIREVVETGRATRARGERRDG